MCWALVLLVCELTTVHAETSDVPHAPPIVPEVVTSGWETKELGTIRRFELIFEASPIGWRFDDDDNGYVAMARLGPAIRSKWCGSGGRP